MFAIASGLLTLCGYVPYIVATVRGKAHPSRVSWWIWSGVGLLLLSTYYESGGRAAIGLAIGALIGQIVIAFFSLWYGRGSVTRLDRVCLCGAVATALLWWLTSSPFLPHLLILVIDGFGWFPTFRKTLTDPHSEDLASWSLWTVGAGLSLLDPTHWSLIDLLYPLYIVVTDGLIVLAILARRSRARAMKLTRFCSRRRVQHFCLR